MDYFDKIKEGLADKLKGKELTMDSEFKGLGIDSLDLVDLVFQLEEELNTQFEDEELMQIKTVRDLCQLIDKKVKQPIAYAIGFLFVVQAKLVSSLQAVVHTTYVQQ